MNTISLIVFIILLILIILLIIFISGCYNNSDIKKNFTRRNNYRKKVENFENTHKDRWKKRFEQLNSVDPILYKHHFKPLPEPINNKQVIPKKDKIFVSVASYRDKQCIPTIKNLADMADNPENLVIYICQQNSIFDKDCENWCKNDKTNKTCQVSKIERLSHFEAKGPTWARWRNQQKWDGEEYFMQIDSHTRMTKGWDTKLKEQLALCPSEKAILTQYPLEFDIVTNEKDQGDPIKENWRVDKNRGGMYIQKFDMNDGLYRIQSDYTTTSTRYPFKSYAWAAGFSFSRGEICREVSYDPYTPFLFFGEEMDIAARAWTCGWDLYSPSIPVVFHNYKRDHRSTFWENPSQKPLEILSRFRIYVRLGYLSKDDIPEKYKFILTDIDKFPIEKERSLHDWQKLLSIDLKNEILKNHN